MVPDASSSSAGEMTTDVSLCVSVCVRLVRPQLYVCVSQNVVRMSMQVPVHLYLGRIVLIGSLQTIVHTSGKFS